MYRPGKRILGRLKQNEEYCDVLDGMGEYYSRIKAERGTAAAAFWLIGDIIQTLPNILYDNILWSVTMFFNYIISAWRNIRKHKLNSIINISGLGFGIATTILIMVWVQDELSYDRFHDNAENIFRITSVWHNSDGSFTPIINTSYPVGIGLKNQYPEVLDAVRVSRYGETLIGTDEKRFYEDGLYFVDSNFFRIFSFPLVSGDSTLVLKELNSIVISESVARKYFGASDPVGKILNIDYTTDFTVTGVFRDMPDNSHLKYDFIGNLDYRLSKGYHTEWDDHVYVTYALLQEGVDALSFGEKIRHLFDTVEEEPTTMDLYLQPLKDIYLGSVNTNSTEGYNIDGYTYIYIFQTIAFITLLIACINFMNLAISQSVNRAREIGIRKVSGAQRTQVARQFIVETLTTTFAALLFAIIFVALFLSEFNEITGKNISFADLAGDWRTLIFSAGLAVITGFAASSYPSFVLSSFNPSSVLKGQFRSGSGGRGFQKSMVILQFTLSLLLIIGSLSANTQLNYMQTKTLGVKKDNILYFRTLGSLISNYDAFKNNILSHSDIEKVSTASAVPFTQSFGSTTGVKWEGMEDSFRIYWSHTRVDYEYMNMLDIEMVEGSKFTEENSSEELTSYIINEAGVKAAGISNPIGKRFRLWRNDGIIVGVMKDFHYQSLHRSIKPLIIRLSKTTDPSIWILVKINSNNTKEVIEYISEAYEKFCPEYPFRFRFIDQDYENLYLNDIRTGKIFGYFTVLAVFISCLGLFGLSAFVSTQRTKEIGVRKVLGAGQPGLIMLLAFDFIKWIILANMIAWPVGWFIINRWLENFAYRTEPGFTIFLISGITALSIALLTVSIQTIKAARINPVNSLKHE